MENKKIGKNAVILVALGLMVCVIGLENFFDQRDSCSRVEPRTVIAGTP